MDNSPAAAPQHPDKGGHPAPSFPGAQRPPLAINAGRWVVTMQGAQRPPEENKDLYKKSDLERITQLNQVPNCRARALPSLWITS